MNYVEEIGRLVNELDIEGDHATEIINVFFDCITTKTYPEFLEKCVHRFDKTDLVASGYIEDMKHEMDEVGIAYWETEEYLLVTQYDEMIEYGLVS